MNLKKSIVILTVIAVFIILMAVFALVSFPVAGTVYDYHGYATTIKLGLDLSGGVSAVFNVEDDGSEGDLAARVDGTVLSLQEMLLQEGYPEASVTRTESGGSYSIRVEVPDVNNAEDVLDLIGRPAKLQFVGSSTQGSVGTALPADASGDTYYLAAYTMENTLPKDAPLEYYATAAVFKAIFQPDGLTADGGNYNYKEGDTFFEWNGALYLDLADIMDTYNEDGAFAASQADLVSATTWNDVRQILGTLTQADPTGYYEWLSGQITAATAESTPQPAALTWDHYMLETFGYSRVAGAGATIDLDSHDTQAELLAKGDIRTYRHSECYYTWFIKHAEDGNNEAQGVMEYGIVRNNIYKLKVNSVKGLGSIVPDEDNQLRVSVYVRNWRLLPEESLAL